MDARNFSNDGRNKDIDGSNVYDHVGSINVGEGAGGYGDVGSSEVEFVAFVQQPVTHNCNWCGKSKEYNMVDDCADRQFAALVLRTELISLVMWFHDTANKVFKQWIL